MTRINDTREQIMDRAAQLLMSRGFNGFSYRDISSHLGVKNAAVHYHFPAKTDLALALIDEYRRLLRRRTGEFMAYGGSARQQIEGFFAFSTHQCELGRCICPFGAFSVDYCDLPEEVQTATHSFMDETIRWLTRVMEVGRDSGEFSFAGDARAKALVVLSALQGTRQLARIHDIEILGDVIGQIRQDLGFKS
ncbi:MAG: TetR/AcrR family transcriptional regulator [Lysobacterales bacterium]